MIAEEINFCLQCGTPLIRAQRIGEVRPVCPDCGWIFFPDPKVAAIVLIERDDQVLLVRRANDPGRGLWTLPAGFVDAGEDPARAAERECLEETGLRVEITELIDVLSGQEHPKGAHIMIVYRARILDGDLQPADDADRAAFFPRDSLPNLAFRTTHQILDVGS